MEPRAPMAQPPAFLSLVHLLEGARPLDQPVALGRDRVHRYGDLLLAAAAVAERARGGGRWLLAREDAWGFLTGLLGLLQAGCTVAIPPNHLPATLERLGAGLDGVLREAPAGPGGEPRPGGPLSGALEFWTSGSAGEPKRIAKTLGQMDAEVRMLETVFGARFGPGPVAGTVPHHHIYGCLFRILWPLAAGRPLVAESWADGLGFRPVEPGAAAPALVSSPALLSRLPRLMDLDRHGPIASVAFSSGGPLAGADALAWRRWVPGGVAEIYGSTETGGIAWRVQDQDPDSALWTPCPDVTVGFAPDGALMLCSARVGPGWHRMEDAAEAVQGHQGGGRFRLLGRLDRIVKLEEKRIALPELEASLAALPWVEQAALVLLDGPRPALGAVLVLTGAGRALAQERRRELIQRLKRHLAERFEGVAVPKRWRILDRLPLDDRGKLTAAALAGLFDPEPARTLPAILSHTRGEQDVFALDLAPDLLAFQGHFPGNPILPGVVQVDWAIRLGAQAFGELGRFRAVTHLKFLGLVRPGDPLELSLALDPDRRLRFTYTVAAERKSSGIVVFGPAD